MFTQAELDDIWDGFQECVEWTEETRHGGKDGIEMGEAEWNGDIDYGDIRRYVDDFAQANFEDIMEFLRLRRDFGEAAVALSYVGHDLWLTANGHGTGFWDRGLDELGTRLAKAAHESGCNADSYIGDDGVMYLSGFDQPITRGEP